MEEEDDDHDDEICCSFMFLVLKDFKSYVKENLMIFVIFSGFFFFVTFCSPRVLLRMPLPFLVAAQVDFRRRRRSSCKPGSCKRRPARRRFLGRLVGVLVWWAFGEVEGGIWSVCRVGFLLGVKKLDRSGYEVFKGFLMVFLYA